MSNIFCQLCNLNKVEHAFYNPLISINLQDISRQNLIEINFSKFNGNEGSCETCTFTNEERIKKEVIYHICQKTFFFDLKFLLYYALYQIFLAIIIKIQVNFII